MVLTRAALEKLNKEELMSLFAVNDDKLNSNIVNQLAEVNKILEMMESQLEILKTKNNLEKRITSLEKQC